MCENTCLIFNLNKNISRDIILLAKKLNKTERIFNNKIILLHKSNNFYKIGNIIVSHNFSIKKLIENNQDKYISEDIINYQHITNKIINSTLLNDTNEANEENNIYYLPHTCIIYDYISGEKIYYIDNTVSANNHRILQINNGNQLILV